MLFLMQLHIALRTVIIEPSIKLIAFDGDLEEVFHRSDEHESSLSGDFPIVNRIRA